MGACPLQSSSASKSENEHENLPGQNSSGNRNLESEIIQSLRYPLTVVDPQDKSIINPSDYSLGASGPKTLEMKIATGFSLEGQKSEVGGVDWGGWGRSVVTLWSRWNHCGVTLGSLWDHFEIILLRFWNNSGIILGSFWGLLGIILGSLWKHLGITLGSLWGNFVITLILLGGRDT